ncbi:Ff.00g089080.m01.CDS01 [Fusarium sp. VM40]|nr:Ff.00g089080.m01.CDS01 [Fusarium sp. VM40]
MSLFTAQLHPGRALGFLVLGATLHDVLTRLKAEPQRFPKIELLYSPDRPVTEPVGVELPGNGMRLRFDGPEQRLRLIEVTDFTKNHITFKERDLVKPTAGSSAPGSPVPGDSTSGPTFRHIYHKLLGPTYAGEFIHPPSPHDNGIYVLSYPGVAFNFSLNPSEYSPEKDVVSTFATASSQVATSMAVFSGDSWADARPTLWTEILPSIKSTTVIPRGKDVYPDEISLVRLHGGGKIQLFRKWTSNCFWITLGETTPQDLLMELGPPNAIYRKNDQKMVIHKMRTASNTKVRPDAADIGRPEDLTDTDQSSMHDGSDGSDNEEAIDDQIGLNSSGECFYNYFFLGFDILISTRVPPSQAPPGSKTSEAEGQSGIISHSPDRLVATKLVLHGNIPGSYEFNRHRRCRWEIAYLDSLDDGSRPTNSETSFPQIEDRMNAAWASAFPRNDSQQRQRGMVLNRGWGDSPGSSCEFLGGWEESGAKRAEANGDSTTTLYGFPGMVFEVLRNGHVNTVTVF